LAGDPAGPAELTVRPAPFNYYRPTDLGEALALMSQHPEAKVLAGGHSLLPLMKLRLATPATLVDIGDLGALRGIEVDAGSLTIGALTTHAAIAGSEEIRRGCPLLAEAAALIGDLQVRNRGTIGGSLAHADPGADLPPVLLALGATMLIAGPAGARELAIDDFLVDLFTTALQPGELLAAIRVPVGGPATGAAYFKHRHPASSYAVVGAAALVELAGGRCVRVRLAIGGVTSRARNAPAVEQSLTGKAPDEATIAAAAGRVAEALDDPLSDLYASGGYRQHLATVLARKALASAAERAGR
jgi:carbon-monoxide dehydrogenase medium subunit